MNKAKKELYAVMKTCRESNLMKQLHDAFGIDFEQPFVFKQWDNRLTENSFQNVYGCKGKFFLIMVRDNWCNEYKHLNVVVVNNGVFNHNQEGRSHYPTYWRKGDFESDRKKVGTSEVSCYVLNPSVIGVERTSKTESEIHAMIAKRLVRVMKSREVHYSNGRFAYYNSLKLERFDVEHNFHFEGELDKSGYASRSKELRLKADAIIREKKYKIANDTDFGMQVNDCARMIEEMKGKVLEMMEKMLSNPTYGNYSDVYDSVGSLYRASETLKTMKDAISSKTVKSVEWVESCFEHIKELAKKYSETENEVA